MNELSLFTGAGGGVLGSILLGHRTIGYVENDEYCQKVLRQRINDGILDEAPIFGDIKAFNSERFAESYQGLVDIVSGGFPCQPFSNAGKRLCENDKRNMWPETAKTISIIKPKHVLLENVPGISAYLPVVARDLRRIGYTVRRPRIIAAASLGAGHIRRRVWLYAYIDTEGFTDSKRQPAAKKKADIRQSTGLDDSQAILADINSIGKLQPQGGIQEQWKRFGYCRWWETEPDVVRVVYGVPNGMDRVGALGNAQVPAVAATAFRILSKYITAA